MQRRRILWLAVLLAGAASIVACGDDPQPPPRPVDAAPPELPVLSSMERAKYALDRLVRGPAPLDGLVVPDIHPRSLELAFADLLAMEREATELLSDAEFRTRITAAGRVQPDPWSNVLRLMLGFESRSPELSAAWTRPALDLPRSDEFISLRAEAARVASLVPGPATAEILLGLFEQSPADREIAAVVFSALVRIPSHREAALDVALRHGGPSLWSDAWSRLGGVVPAGEIDADIAGALAWWVGLTSGSGPRMPVELPWIKAQPWMQARLGTDPAVPRGRSEAEGPRRPVLAALPSEVMLGSGWLATDLADSAIFPVHGYLFTGKLPAGEGRCVLGQWGFEGYRAAVRGDLGLEGVDDGLYYAAKHCMLDTAPSSDAQVLEKIDASLDSTPVWDALGVRQLQQKVDALASCDAPGAWERLVRVLREVRPLDTARPLLDAAYDKMLAREHELFPLVSELLRGGPEDVGVALYLIRRARDPAYLGTLEACLETAQDASLRRVLQRTLVFIYARGYGIAPQRYETFVQQYTGWLEGAPPQQAAALATGLLDLEAPGIQAFADGLRGPRREVFLAAWPRDRRLVPLVVAEALLAPIGPTTSAAERMHALGLAYLSFPRAADGLLEALRRRLPLEERGPVQAALERVRHRAERHKDR